MFKFSKPFGFLKEVGKLSPIFALALLAACANHDDNANRAPDPQPTPVSPAPQPLSSASPTPTATPAPPLAPQNPMVSQSGCTVKMTGHVPAKFQMPGTFEIFSVTLVIAANGNYKLNVERQSCFNQASLPACGYMQNYWESSAKYNRTEAALFEGEGKVLGYVSVYSTEPTLRARLLIDDPELKNLGLPDLIYLNASSCTPDSPPTSTK